MKGIAWTGEGKISKVEISLDNGQTWAQCQYTSAPEKNSWVSWSYKWGVYEKGEYTLQSKATDSYGYLSK